METVSRSQVRIIYGRRSSLVLGATQTFVALGVLYLAHNYFFYVESVTVSWRCSAYCVPLASFLFV